MHTLVHLLKKKRTFSNLPNFEKEFGQESHLKIGRIWSCWKEENLSFQKMSGLLFGILHQEKVVSCFENLVAQMELLQQSETFGLKDDQSFIPSRSTTTKPV